MTRMIDLTRRYGVRPQPDPLWDDFECESDRGVFVIDEVAEWVYAVQAEDEGLDVRADYPCLAPPYSWSWFEFRPPTGYRCGDQLISDTSRNRPAFFGGIILALDAAANGERGYREWIDRFGVYPEYMPDGDDREARWVLAIMPYLNWGRHSGRAVGEFRLLLDRQGAAMADAVYLVPDWAKNLGEEWEPTIENTRTLLYPFLTALSLLNCVNVTTEEVAPPPKLSRAFARRAGGLPLTTYKVLDIRGPRRVAAGAGGGRLGQRIALHQVRGHFKTFTAESPLFGKRVGRYFWHPALRGDPAAGEVKKDYRLHRSAAMHGV